MLVFNANIDSETALHLASVASHGSVDERIVQHVGEIVAHEPAKPKSINTDPPRRAEEECSSHKKQKRKGAREISGESKRKGIRKGEGEKKAR